MAADECRRTSIISTMPRGLSYEVFSPPALPGWDLMPATVSKAFGEQCASSGEVCC
jgi:RES domain-containing protein